MKDQEVAFFYHIGQLILYTLAADLMLVTLLFFFNKPVSVYTLPLAFGIALVLLFRFYQQKEESRYVLLEVATFLILLIGAVWLEGKWHSLDWDGNAYHKFAVGLLQRGWNPFYESSDQFSKSLFGSEFGSGTSLWIDHYPKQSWIFGASIYSLTDNVDAGKAYQLLALAAVFCLALSYMRSKNLKRWQCMAVGLAAGCNPVALAQIDSYYVDGYLANMLIALILALTMNLDKEYAYSGQSAASLIASAMLVCANIKFTGLLYGGIYCMTYFLFWVVLQYRENRKTWVWLSCRRCGWFALLAGICVLWPGYTTYMMNFLQHGSFTYPLTGKGAVDIMTANSPRAFTEISPLESLFYSLFSRTDNLVYNSPGRPILKLPFTVHSGETTYCSLADTRIAGFGVLFSGILLCAIVVLIWKLVKMPKKVSFAFWMMHIMLILGLCLVISESWWARYAPYIYFIVLVALILLCVGKGEQAPEMGEKAAKVGRKRSRLLAQVAFGVIFILLSVNNTFFLPYGIFPISANIKNEAVSLAKYGSVRMNFTYFPGLIFNYMDAGVHVIPDPSVMKANCTNSCAYGKVFYLLGEAEK